MKDSKQWNWGQGFCNLHRGQDLPCRTCIEAKHPDVMDDDAHKSEWQSKNPIEKLTQILNTFDDSRINVFDNPNLGKSHFEFSPMLRLKEMEYQQIPPKTYPNPFYMMKVQEIRVAEIIYNSIYSQAQTQKQLDLIASIKKYGLQDPLLVKKMVGYYELIEGSCRYFAAKDLGFMTVPCFVLGA